MDPPVVFPDAQSVLAEVKRLHGTLIRAGPNRLRLWVPGGASPALKEAVKTHKSELVGMLTEEHTNGTRPATEPIDLESQRSSRVSGYQLTSGDPQFYQQYTGVRNVVFDMVMPVLDPSAWKLLCYLIRRIDGYVDHRATGSDWVSMVQMMGGTRLARNTVKAALRELVDSELIVCTQEQRSRGVKRAARIVLHLPKDREEGAAWVSKFDREVSNFDSQVSKFDRPI